MRLTIYFKEEFTDASWSTPESDLSADEYCRVCLVDYNTTGEEKTKAKCKLPIRSRPGAPVNKNALRNASSRLPQMTEVPSEQVSRAKSRLEALKKQAEMGDEQKGGT